MCLLSALISVKDNVSDVCDNQQAEQKERKPFADPWESSELEEESSVDRKKKCVTPCTTA